MTTAADFIAVARSEIGYVETPVNKTKFAAEAGHAQGEPWCATFLVAIAHRVGLALPSHSAYTPTLAEGFKNAGTWHDDPAPGDFVFYDWPGDGVNRIQHVEVVADVSVWSLATIGGNTSPDTHGSQSNGGGVYPRKRPRDSSIIGFGRPDYTEADMALSDDDKKWITDTVYNVVTERLADHDLNPHDRVWIIDTVYNVVTERLENAKQSP